METAMTSKPDYAAQQAKRAAETYKPPPVYKPNTPDPIKKASDAAYNTAARNLSSGKKK
jgi:hypothetical protein